MDFADAPRSGLPSRPHGAFLGQSVLAHDVAVVEIEQRVQLADHPRERQVGQIGVGVAAAYVRVHTGEPALLQHLRQCLPIRLLPNRRTERSSPLIEGQCLEGILDVRLDLGIDEAEFRHWRLRQDGDHGDPERSDRVPDRDALDRDVRLRQLELEQFPLILWRMEGGPIRPWLLGEAGRPPALALIFPVLEDGVEVGQSPIGQQAHRADQAGHAAGGEGTAREAENEYLVPVGVVVAQETVRLADVFGQAFARGAADHLLVQTGAGADSGLVVDRLWGGEVGGAVQADGLEAAAYAGHIGGCLGVGAVAVQPGPITADDDPFLEGGWGD